MRAGQPQNGGTNDAVLEFIRAAKAHGMEDSFAVQLLKHNGWSERTIFQAYVSYYGDALQKPVPSRGAGIENARHAFFYLLAFSTLGTWTFALGNLFYVFIDRRLQDPLTAPMIAGARTTISYDVAALIIAFPIFLWMTWIVQHEAAQRPEVLDSGVRKWLTYLALVLTASLLIGDAVFFVQEFLTGSLSEAFILKSLVLIAIAGGVFYYYLGAVRAESANVRRDQLFGSAAIAAVCIGIGIGFVQNGTPLAQRETTFDQRRVSDLREIDRRVSWWAEKHREVPSNVDQLFANTPKIVDPQTHVEYEYRAVGATRYRLCAVFETSDQNALEDDAFRHGAGHVCFMRDINAP